MLLHHLHIGRPPASKLTHTHTTTTTTTNSTMTHTDAKADPAPQLRSLHSSPTDQPSPLQQQQQQPQPPAHPTSTQAMASPLPPEAGAASSQASPPITHGLLLLLVLQHPGRTQPLHCIALCPGVLQQVPAAPCPLGSVDRMSSSRVGTCLRLWGMTWWEGNEVRDGGDQGVSSGDGREWRVVAGGSRVEGGAGAVGGVDRWEQGRTGDCGGGGRVLVEGRGMTGVLWEQLEELDWMRARAGGRWGVS